MHAKKIFSALAKMAKMYYKPFHACIQYLNSAQLSTCNDRMFSKSEIFWHAFSFILIIYENLYHNIVKSWPFVCLCLCCCESRLRTQWVCKMWRKCTMDFGNANCNCNCNHRTENLITNQTNGLLSHSFRCVLSLLLLLLLSVKRKRNNNNNKYSRIV